MNNVDANNLTADNIVTFLADVFERRGSEEYLGEDVTMAEHMLQGAYFAEQNGESDTIIVAALLHDIGHFTSEFGMFAMTDTKDKHHEVAGGRLLEKFFPPVIKECVNQHVAAKRYLCATRPEYMSKLSTASIHSLNLQGGPMSSEEVAEFEKQPYLEEIVKVRYLDDKGKIANYKTPDFSHYVPLVQKIVDSHCKTSR